MKQPISQAHSLDMIENAPPLTSKVRDGDIVSNEKDPEEVIDLTDRAE